MHKQQIQKLLKHPLRVIDDDSLKSHTTSFKIICKKTGFNKPKDQYCRMGFHLGAIVVNKDGTYSIVGLYNNFKYKYKIPHISMSIGDLITNIHHAWDQFLESIGIDLEVMFILLSRLRNVQYRVIRMSGGSSRGEHIEIGIVRAKELGCRRIEYSHITLVLSSRHSGQLHVKSDRKIIYDFIRTTDLGLISLSSPEITKTFVHDIEKFLAMTTTKVVLNKRVANKWLNFGITR